MKRKNPSCPKCPSVKFKAGKIRIGNDKTADVVLCARCSAIISLFEHSLKDTLIEEPAIKGNSSSVGEAKTLWG